MPTTKRVQDFVDYLVELMQTIGPVRSKRMFGGHGIFLEGLMFGLVVDNALYLKADHESESGFVALGLEKFTYYRSGRATRLSYYQAPDEALENIEEMQRWANEAYACALRVARRKSQRSVKTKNEGNPQ